MYKFFNDPPISMSAMPFNNISFPEDLSKVIADLQAHIRRLEQALAMKNQTNVFCSGQNILEERNQRIAYRYYAPHLSQSI